jgi:mono/diheme cytochrome c family protein
MRLRISIGLFVAVAVMADDQLKRMSPDKVAAEHSTPKLDPAARHRQISEVAEAVSAKLPPAGEQSSKVVRRNLIDQHLFGAMENDRVPHAPLATDLEFCRRIYLDMIGRPPTPEQIRVFTADTRPGKRDRLIDELMASEAWSDRWGYFFGDQFRAALNRIGRPALGHFDRWMREGLQSDKPYNQFVSELMTASAPNSNWMPDAAPANFLARWHVQGDDALSNMHEDTADEIIVNASRIFLGMNVQCISCHGGKGFLDKVNLGLVDKKRQDFWAMAAFFGKTRVRIVPYQDRFTVSDDADGYDTAAASIVRLKRTGTKIIPKFLLTGEEADMTKPLRPQFARMLTSHPQFAKATVNLFWREFFGMGIVDPVDSFDLARQDPKNPPPAPWLVQPTNPELLEDLAAAFVKNNYSLKWLMRTIAQSSAYQLSSRFEGEWKETWTPYFARKFPRLLAAEEIHDAISQATGVYGDYKKSVPYTGRTITQARYFTQLASPDELGNRQIRFFLNTFGQSNRDQFDRQFGGSILQAIVLMNSPFVNSKIAVTPGSRAAELLASRKSDEEIVTELFLAALSRPPVEAEKSVAIESLARDRKQGIEDLQWALLNKMDFLFNY